MIESNQMRMDIFVRLPRGSMYFSFSLNAAFGGCAVSNGGLTSRSSS